MNNSDQILSRLNEIESKLEKFHKEWFDSHVQMGKFLTAAHNKMDNMIFSIDVGFRPKRWGPVSKTIFDRIDDLERGLVEISYLWKKNNLK